MGSARDRARRDGFDSLFRELAPALRRADVSFANLEMPIAHPEWVQTHKVAAESWHDEDLAQTLFTSGVRVVSIANNHIMDCGPRGLLRTREACEQAGLAVVGAGANLDEARRPARLTVKGVRVIVLAYAAPSRQDSAGANSPGLAPLSLPLIAEDIARWRSECDVLVVSAHWGSMYVDYPPPRVLELAQGLVQSGADVILGHHPHVTQGYRRHGPALVLFSLGDAVFNSHSGHFHSSVGSEQRLRTGVFTVLVADEAGLEFEPMLLDEDGVPSPADDAEASRQIARLAAISMGLEAGPERFHRTSASALLRYELEAAGHHLRAGRPDRVLRMLGTVKPRHARLLWHALLNLWRRS
jgi:poly-gamma-glutamate capsule biosynthesis protein CapA/YwtB (metallophosphatase superfamily)